MRLIAATCFAIALIGELSSFFLFNGGPLVWLTGGLLAFAFTGSIRINVQK